MHQNQSRHNSKLTQAVREAISCSKSHYKTVIFSMIIVKPVPQPWSPLQFLAHFPAPFLFPVFSNVWPVLPQRHHNHRGRISGSLFSSARSHTTSFLQAQLGWQGRVPPHVSSIFSLSTETTTSGLAAKRIAVVWH